MAIFAVVLTSVFFHTSSINFILSADKRRAIFITSLKGGILVWDRAFSLIFTLEKTEIIFNFGNKITNSANQTLGIAIILDIMEILQVSSATLMILFMKMTMIARSSVYGTT